MARSGETAGHYVRTLSERMIFIVQKVGLEPTQPVKAKGF